MPLLRSRAEVVNVGNVQVRVYPTQIRFPLWFRPNLTPAILDRLKISDVSVRSLSTTPNFKGLSASFLRPEYKIVLDPSEIIDTVKVEARVDGTEIVEWMQTAYAENVVMQARIQEYNRLGSQLSGNSTDAYIPGCVIEDIRYNSEPGSTISSRGFAVAATPRGNFNVPNLRKAVGAFRDILSWGSISWTGSFQWIGNLLKWRSLAETPITQSVGFYMDTAGNQAPNFFSQVATVPRPTVTIRMVLSSNDRQTIKINFRDPTDYSRVVGTKQFDVASGQSEATFTVTAFPYVPPLISEIQPQDKIQTTLNQYLIS